MTWKRFAARQEKARKIHGMISEFMEGKDPDELLCLEIGCGNGEIARYLSDYFGKMVALDNVFRLVHEASKKGPSPRLSFLQADGTCLPLSSATFDVVICAQVYEHVVNAERLSGEIERVLKPGGLCFFSGPNKLWPIEPHYLLPFVHWLPDSLAALYMRASGKGEHFDMHPYTYWHLQRLWGRFAVHDCTVALLREPHRYGLSTPVAWVFRWIPAPLLSICYFLLPNYNWVLVKPHEKKNPHRCSGH